jgi:hypothetical protein
MVSAADVPQSAGAAVYARHFKWAFGFSGDVTAFAAPTVQNGSLFVGSAGGMLFVNSGYPRFGGMPGNVLLAFGVPEAGR